MVITNVAGSLTSAPALLTVNQLNPLLTWTNPVTIGYGTPLSGVQLNAQANVGGGFVYTSTNGTVLPAGNHTLNVSFNPNDPTNYVTTNASVSLTVNQASLLVKAENKTRLYGTTNPVFTVKHTGFVNGETNNVLSSQPIATSAATTNSIPGAYSIAVSGATASNYSITHSNGVLTVTADPPAITQQPTNLVVIATSNAVFTVNNGGTLPYAYQWYFNQTNVLSGSTNATLTLTNAQPVNVGDYTVVVTNIIGSVTSSVASLTVLVPPAIVQQPTNQTVAPGVTATLVVGATGFPLQYQWYYGSNSVLAATNALLNIPDIQPVQAGDYHVVVSNLLGSVTSSVAQISLAALINITRHPDSQTVRVGNNVILQLQADSVAPLWITWYRNGFPVASGTNRNLTLSAVGRMHQGNYHAVVTNIVEQASSSNAFVRVQSMTRVELIELNVGSRILHFVSFGDHDGNLLTADAFSNFVIQASSDLVTWTNLSVNGDGLNIVNGKFLFQDNVASQAVSRYYRVYER